LGSGNFGSVYVGEAEGLFYPGSVTTVAVKTVNDALDRSQLTALLCEVKILANLEHHLNLVNLMGSCTSELHNGELWLLLEFCGHGDLKVIYIIFRCNEFIKHRVKLAFVDQSYIILQGQSGQGYCHACMYNAAYTDLINSF
jgi:serine/threonine protein kinase